VDAAATNRLIAFIKQLGLFKTILMALTLVLAPFALVHAFYFVCGVFQFFYQCVLMIGSGCDL
jgi:hypothetical protein